jgi:hypothetical protein
LDGTPLTGADVVAIVDHYNMSVAVFNTRTLTRLPLAVTAVEVNGLEITIKYAVLDRAAADAITSKFRDGLRKRCAYALTDEAERFLLKSFSVLTIHTDREWAEGEVTFIEYRKPYIPMPKPVTGRVRYKRIGPGTFEVRIGRHGLVLGTVGKLYGVHTAYKKGPGYIPREHLIKAHKFMRDAVAWLKGAK